MPEGLILKTPPFDAYEQMAADEHFCSSLPAKFLLRFYNWNSKGLTFGYSQRFAFVAENARKDGKANVAAVRRPTGGGMVYHESDLTFSFIFHCPQELFNPQAVYSRLHEAMRREYGKAGINFSILNEKTKSYDANFPSAMECFKKPVSLDLMTEGRKVLGGALRKFSDYMLYQASLQLRGARESAGFHARAIAKAFSNEFNIVWSGRKACSRDLLEIARVKRSKYATDAWNKRI